MLEEVRAHKVVYVFLFCAIALGVFLRVYRHAELLHFELDQARDVFVVHDALETGVMPLLGPYARGSELYLGPIFYYFQAAAAFLFGAEPSIVALPDLVFSILFLPLLYLFARLYFSRTVSMMLVAIAASSLFLVTYGRFAWNPNALPFWITLSVYGLLRSWENKTFHGKWFLMMVAAAAVAMQLHFVAFLTLPLVLLLYFFIVRMRISLGMIVSSAALFLLLYAPVVVSEFQTGSANTKALFVTIIEKGDKDNKHNIFEKVFRGVQETSTYNWVLLSSNQQGGDNIRTKSRKNGYFLCDDKCEARLGSHILAIGAFLILIGTFLWQFVCQWKRRKDNREQNNLWQRQTVIVLWLAVTSIFFVLMAYQISPRFYLLIVPALLVVIGSSLSWLQRRLGSIGFVISVGLVACLFFSNLVQTKQYFSVLDSAQVNGEKQEWRDLIMGRADYITLQQLREAAEHISGQKNKNNFFVVGDNRYARALYFLVSVEGGADGAQCYIKRSSFDAKQVEGADYYVLVRKKSKTQLEESMLDEHEIADEKQFGTIVLYKMEPKERVEIEKSGLPKRCFVR